MDFNKFFKVLVGFEGLKLQAYKDSGGVATIGIGTIKYPNGTVVKMGDCCSEQEAFEWATGDVESRLEKIKSLLKVELNDAQLIALLSLAYNIGINALANSTVLRSINSGLPLSSIQAGWMMWCKDNGKTVEGLENRRKKEFAIYSGQTPV